MKKILCFLVLISLLATVSCKRIENYSKFNIAYAEDFEELNIENEINSGKEGFYGFTADLFSKTDGENELLAPFSSYTALAMVYNGAEGRTKEEMHEA